MGILLEKNNKDGEVLNIENYSEILKFELLEYFSKNISDFINKNEYQNALEYTENFINKKLEIPLRVNSKYRLNGSINELIINEKTKFMNFFVYLKNELLSCKKFCFIVSFIKYSGIQLLVNTLNELEKLGIEGRIITSVYLNITDEKALRKLLSYKNIKVKVYNNAGESFHTKAYIFKKKEYSTCIVGSSNISQSALYSAEEWNVKMTDSDFFNIYDKSMKQFEKIWNSNESIILTEDFIDKYEKYKNENSMQKTFNYNKIENSRGKFSPNSMQKEILEKLKNTRNAGNKKGVVVAATGTGKTYLAAMDIKNFFKELKYKETEYTEDSLLFIAHREELLENAINVCEIILNEDIKNFGRLYRGLKEINKKIIFATVQSLRSCYKDFDKKYFRYIVIDEFHHASADSYKKIISYFSPDFLLGLTATPERMDGKNILELCDYNLIGEIGLKKALEKDLITPFHYFGVNDTFDYSDIPYENGKYSEKELVKKLSDNKRVEFIIEKIKEIGYDGNKMKCIAFCENIAHAVYMKKEFEKNNYTSDILTSKTNTTERSNVMKKLKSGLIEIICVVDILNEGIDIPDINLLLFLRPTLSSTVFIQQIGRGLRKTEGKEFVTIIDFIGNHKKDYLITKVFSDEINEKGFLYNRKEKIISEIKNQFGNIPGGSYIELDRICQERIINKIEKINFNSKSMLKEMYAEHKADIGKSGHEVLNISDFDLNMEFLLELILKLGSFYDAQIAFENLDFIKKFSLKTKEKEILTYFEKKLTLTEPFTYLILKKLLEGHFKDQKNYKKNILSDTCFIDSTILLEEYNKYVEGRYEFKKLYLIERIFSELVEDKILTESEYGYRLSDRYSGIFRNNKNENFINRISELIILGLNEFKKNNLEEFNNNILIAYKEYTRLELQILLDSRVPKGSWRSGYANTDSDICLFITNDKSHIVKENLKYDNSLYSDRLIQWISQPKTFHESPVGQMFIKHSKKNISVHIFARKYAFSNSNGNRTNPFIYLGKAEYYSSHGDRPMTILWKLEKRIPQNIINELY